MTVRFWLEQLRGIVCVVPCLANRTKFPKNSRQLEIKLQMECGKDTNLDRIAIYNDQKTSTKDTVGYEKQGFRIIIKGFDVYAT